MSSNTEWNLELSLSDDEDDIVYVTATSCTSTLYAAARVVSKKNRTFVSLSQWETPEGEHVDDSRLTRRAMTAVRHFRR